MPNHPWQDLLVWQKAHDLVIRLYQTTSGFPDSEKWGISYQIRKAAVSITANIVEGKSKNTDKEFQHFLYISRGSLEETRYYILLAKDLNYICEKDFLEIESLCREVSFLLNQLIKAIRV